MTHSTVEETARCADCDAVALSEQMAECRDCRGDLCPSCTEDARGNTGRCTDCAQQMRLRQLTPRWYQWSR